MTEVAIQLDKEGYGAFFIREGTKMMGGMEVSVSGSNLTVYNTEVLPEAEGKGFAKKLVTAMADYARANGLKVIPLCPYTLAQFKRNPEGYNDIWNKQGK